MIFRSTKSLCINFGHLTFKSDPKVVNKIEKQDDIDEESFHSATDDEDEILHETCKESRCKPKETVEKTVDLKKVDEKLSSNKEEVIDASYWKYQIYLKQIQITLIDNIQDFEMFKNNLNTSIHQIDPNEYKALYDKCYVLTPLDLFFNIHQCVYADDIKLPAWKIFGNLPLIDFTLTDLKLEQIIKLFLSVPLPKSDRTEDVIVFDETLDDFSETNKDLIERRLIKSQDSSDSLLTKSSFITLENLQQSTNLEFSFEINEIIFKLKETKTEHFDWVLFKISSFGTFIQQKTYDNYVNIYLNQIKCEYGLFKDVNGQTLYLISSLNEKIQTKELTSSRCDLIDIKITQTDPQSPTLGLLHDNVLLNLNIQMCAIDFVFNLVAFKNILNFAEKFERNINSAKYLQYEVDIEQLQGSKKKPTSKANNQPLLNDNQIKYLINKKSSQRKPKDLTDSNLIELKLNAKLDGIRARISTSKKNYFFMSVNTLELSTIGTAAQFDVAFLLNSISLLDLNTNSSANKIISLKEDTKNLIDVKLTLFNAPRTALSEISILAAQYQKEKFYFKNYLNENHFDLVVQATISKLKLLFFYKHINTVLVSFLKKFIII